MSDGDVGAIDRPDWLPDDYDPDASLEDRLDAIHDLRIAFELHVQGEHGSREVVGCPVHSTSTDRSLQICCGNSEHTWQWEIHLSRKTGKARLENVDPEQDIELYEATKQVWLSDVDVRIYAVDDHYLDEDGGSE